VISLYTICVCITDFVSTCTLKHVIHSERNLVISFPH